MLGRVYPKAAHKSSRQARDVVPQFKEAAQARPRNAHIWELLGDLLASLEPAGAIARPAAACCVICLASVGAVWATCWLRWSLRVHVPGLLLACPACGLLMLCGCWLLAAMCVVAVLCWPCLTSSRVAALAMLHCMRSSRDQSLDANHCVWPPQARSRRTTKPSRSGARQRQPPRQAAQKTAARNPASCRPACSTTRQCCTCGRVMRSGHTT